MNELLTVTEVAKKLRVNHTTVRRWITAGSIQAVILPHKNKRQAYRITQETLNDILNGKMFPLVDTPHEI